MAEIDLNAMHAKFAEVFGGGERPVAFRAPGRVNLIGEHTDYNGGHVFPCALSMSIIALARPRADSLVRLYSMNFPGAAPAEADLVGLTYSKERGWANYPLGVLHMIEREIGRSLPGGLDIIYQGNLPDGAGLSSSAAMELLTARIANDLYDLGLDGIKLAKIAQNAESNFVGMHCGIMDQFSISMGKRDHAMLLDCSTLDYEQVPLKLENACIILTNSNKPHTLATSAYNDRRRECEEALAAIRTVKPETPCLCAVTESDFESEPVQAALKNAHACACGCTGGSNSYGEILLRRARHQVTEEARTRKAAEVLKNGDLKAFGKLMNGSHISMRDDFEITCPEIDTLVELAWQHPGVLGSRMTGGGFGGCTVSLVEIDAVESFKRDIGPEYNKRTGLTADFYVVHTADGAGKL